MITVLVKGFFFRIIPLEVIEPVLETTTFLGGVDIILSLMCFSHTGLTTSGLGQVLEGHLHGYLFRIQKLGFALCLKIPSKIDFL